MSKRPPPRHRPGAPSKALAVWFLRQLAQQVGWTVADPAARARDLQLIADCIEGKVKWRTGPRETPEEIRAIAEAVHMVERRPRGMSVERAIELHARNAAKRLGLKASEDQERLARKIASVRRARK